MFKILTGPRMNLVGRGASYGATPTGLSCSASLDAAFPLTNLYDGRPANPARLAATSTGFGFYIPNNLLLNGDFEQGAGSGWASASGATLTSETGAGNYHKGSKSLKVVTAGAYSGAFQDVTVQAGEYLQVWGAAKSDGSNYALVYVLCLDTMKEINSAGTWSAMGTDVFQKTAATMAAFTPVTFRAPTFSELGKSTATLRVLLYGSGAGQTLYFDEVLITVGVNFAGVFGHGLDPSTGLKVWEGGTNYWHSAVWGNAFGADSNQAAARQACYVSDTSLHYNPFVIVWFYPGGASGSFTLSRVPWIGELVVGQSLDLVRNPNYPVSIEYAEPNVRLQSSGGTQWVMPRGTAPRRKVTLSFDYFSDAAYQDARDNLYGMSRGGAYPLVLVPTETDSGEAIYGRLQDSTTFRRDNFATRAAEFIVQEEAFPWL